MVKQEDQCSDQASTAVAHGLSSVLMADSTKPPQITHDPPE
jgi:hypothetical protein